MASEAEPRRNQEESQLTTAEAAKTVGRNVVILLESPMTDVYMWATSPPALTKINEVTMTDMSAVPKNLALTSPPPPWCGRA